jgi:hypothetical protein
MKHVGKMKNNGAKIVIAYRTLPGDANSALVVGTGNLGEAYHDSLMNLIQDTNAQQANELADVLAVRKFPDGNTMLNWLHTYGHLKKVPTNMVIMTPSTQTTLPLDELNQLIADQKGVTIEELSITDGVAPKKPRTTEAPSKTAPALIEMVQEDKTLSPAEMRSKADALFKEAQLLRKVADDIDPPKRKAKKVVAEAE